jgi:hypothetical protein
MGKMIKIIAGLQVYVNSIEMKARSGEKIFYTRREEGPLYLWRWEGTSGKWQFLRLHQSKWRDKALSPEKWQVLPSALQGSLKQHYME